MASNVLTSKKYLVLKTHDASLIDIFHILFTKDIESKDFVETLEVKQEILKERGVIFLSMLSQKILQYNKKTLYLFGSTFEMWLNLLGNKNNFRMFLSALLRGKMELPNQQSFNFLSTIGFLDNRVELDKKIKPGDSKYFAALTAMASKIAYENEEFIQVVVKKIWKMDFLGFYDCWDERHQANTTQGFMFHDKNTNPETIIVAFRGTDPFNADDWTTDIDISWYKFDAINGRVHGGFMKALGLKLDGSWPRDDGAYNAITKDLKNHLENNIRTRFIITGHSLGGALAILFPAVLELHKEAGVLKRLEGVYTFGQPKVGDKKFGKFMDKLLQYYGVKYYRFVYSHDIVPQMPYDDSVLMFKHFGTCIYINCIYERKNVEEESYKNYIDVVTRRIDAFWELVRSFILPRIFGSEYKERLLLQMFRLVGFIIPGFPAHGPQEYINATRLANYSL
ncbi:unnamed protein product [Fraxinus pennsylvanica]|uniref:Fungal lipase-type domain-containing protein n=1 Tax=Fraxinus pennsylvanica TaxID=56036 RepID=A0AAD1YX80_9LAMI|nr:unnamed protein product [Fraxinus pennsylvanica]